MDLNSKYSFYIVLSLSCLAWFYLTFRYSDVTKEQDLLNEQFEFNNFLKNGKWYKKLNLGAFVVTPFWLLANGLWVLMFFYIVLFLVHPMLAFCLSTFLLFRGSSISWAGGYRWANDLEAFLDEQYFWYMFGIIYISCYGLYLVSSYV